MTSWNMASDLLSDVLIKFTQKQRDYFISLKELIFVSCQLLTDNYDKTVIFSQLEQRLN